MAWPTSGRTDDYTLVTLHDNPYPGADALVDEFCAAGQRGLFEIYSSEIYIPNGRSWDAILIYWFGIEQEILLLK